MAYSRVKKYQELRDGIKEEAGIDREKVVDHIIDDEDDDFLSFIKKDVEFQKPQNIEDTLTEPKTFEQMRQEGSKELEEALRDAKKGVGKDNPYNTRMDILSKIRDGEKTTIKIDSVDEYSTDEFARGMFLNEKKDIQAEHPEQEETVKEDEPKKKMTLMEKLASISPEEDARKAQEFLQEEMEKENNEDLQFEEPQEETVEIAKVLEETKEYQQIENDDQLQRTDKDRKEEKVKKDGKIVKVLDIIITVLVMILIVLLCIIIYQNFF